MVLAAGTVAEKKSGFGGWALTLAGRCHVVARGVRPRGHGRLDLRRAASLGAATAIAAALVPAFLLAVGRPPVLPAGPPSTPPPCRRAALRATVPGLGVGWPERLLAPLEQTPPQPGPTNPLTGSRAAASVEWAQGSCELPTARPRARSPLHSAPRRPVLSHWPPWPIPSPYRTADPPAIQQARATSPKPTGFGRSRNRPKQ
jgi:hypothetical protein